MRKKTHEEFVEELNKGMAELSAVEKSKVSHRAKALNKVIEFLEKLKCLIHLS